jgi:hypothetical protein
MLPKVHAVRRVTDVACSMTSLGCRGPERSGATTLVKQRRMSPVLDPPQSVLVYFGLVTQDGVQKRAMNLDFSIVTDEAELAELIHKKANP